jgi:uncharacterized protein YerC
MSNVEISRVTARTLDGLRVALAGLPDEMRVLPFTDDVDVPAVTVAELRSLADLPYALDIFLPYRLIGSSVVVIGRHDQK